MAPDRLNVAQPTMATAAGPPSAESAPVPASPTKVQLAVAEAEESAQQHQTKQLVRMAVIATFAMTLQSRFVAVAQASLLRELLGNDVGRTASKLAIMTTVSSLASFVANPALGQASDVFGRKFFMLLSPAMIFIARAGVLVYPSVRFCAAGIWFELRLELTGCTTTGRDDMAEPISDLHFQPVVQQRRPGRHRRHHGQQPD